MDQFYIKSGSSYWTGRAWSTFKTFATTHSFDDGQKIIQKRWSEGMDKRTNNGEIYTIQKPKLIPIHE